MLKRKLRYSLLFLVLISNAYSTLGQKTVKPDEIKKLYINLKTGPSHINPSFVLWIEDSVGNYLRTLFVTKSVGTGVYKMATKKGFSWKEGALTIEGALPVWAHRRGIKNKKGGFAPTPDTPVPDAFTGATPFENTRVHMKVDVSKLPKFRLFLEINQSHDFNEFYDKVDDEEENLQSVGQPSIVYGKFIDLTTDKEQFNLLPLGHSAPEGETGKLYQGLKNIDSALWLLEKIVLSVEN